MRVATPRVAAYANQVAPCNWASSLGGAGRTDANGTANEGAYSGHLKTMLATSDRLTLQEDLRPYSRACPLGRERNYDHSIASRARFEDSNLRERSFNAWWMRWPKAWAWPGVALNVFGSNSAAQALYRSSGSVTGLSMYQASFHQPCRLPPPSRLLLSGFGRRSGSSCGSRQCQSASTSRSRPAVPLPRGTGRRYLSEQRWRT